MKLLMGGPRRIASEQGVSQRFVILEQGKLPPFQKKTEMTNSSVGSQELSVEGGVFRLSGSKLLGEESQRRPGTLELLLKYSTHVGVGGVDSKRDRSPRFRVIQYRD